MSEHSPLCKASACVCFTAHAGQAEMLSTSMAKLSMVGTPIDRIISHLKIASRDKSVVRPIEIMLLQREAVGRIVYA